MQHKVRTASQATHTNTQALEFSKDPVPDAKQQDSYCFNMRIIQTSILAASPKLSEHPSFHKQPGRREEEQNLTRGFA